MSTTYAGVIRSFQFAICAKILTVEPAVDGVGGLLAREHRCNNHVRTGNAISASEHAGDFGLKRQGIGTERSRFCGRQAQTFAQAVHIGDLANCGYDSVAGDDERRAGNRLGGWTAAGIGPAEFHFHALKAGHAATGSRLE